MIFKSKCCIRFIFKFWSYILRLVLTTIFIISFDLPQFFNNLLMNNFREFQFLIKLDIESATASQLDPGSRRRRERRRHRRQLRVTTPHWMTSWADEVALFVRLGKRSPDWSPQPTSYFSSFDERETLKIVIRKCYSFPIWPLIFIKHHIFPVLPRLVTEAEGKWSQRAVNQLGYLSQPGSLVEGPTTLGAFVPNLFYHLYPGIDEVCGLIFYLNVLLDHWSDVSEVIQPVGWGIFVLFQKMHAFCRHQSICEWRNCLLKS